MPKCDTSTNKNLLSNTRFQRFAVDRLEDLIAKLLKGERDPEAARKSRERMDLMREATRRRVGTVEVAVDFIRELRDQRAYSFSTVLSP